VKTLPSQWAVTQLYLAHFAVSDLSKGRFHYAEKISRAGLGKAGAARERLHVWIDQWSAESPSATPGTQTLHATDGDLALQLTVSPETISHATDGISHKGSAVGQASHYYSFTRLATTGSLSIGGERFDVIGNSWMDHEFGSADLDKDLVGWDWFSLQLNDQRELMLYRLRRADGSADPASSGTVIDHDGRGHHLSIGDFTLEPTSHWTSRTTQARYPHRWRQFPQAPAGSLPLMAIKNSPPRAAHKDLLEAHRDHWHGTGQPIHGKVIGADWLRRTLMMTR
jgi:predicted secreted hydrolase